ncbi:hypothetical protein CCHR01_01127 [Colletotrichum chrysophilum]|uniref:Uncharacterized protein n=1 Tax=Colletotrichum chrysophilum TaxID=1836956 RepID=A0AAD9EPH4_9PEZI|nr:hypothetical protein CCHR01_01127 [Colletotrichum chrysophilum]
MSNTLPPASLPAFSTRSHSTPEARHILWRLQGPLSDSVFVLQDRERKPYVIASGPAGNPGLHPTAQASLTNPKSDQLPSTLTFCGGGRRSGLNDTNRPKKAQPLVSNASDTYVTVHDYLSALHLWLMGLRDDIVRADDVWEDKTPDNYRNPVGNFTLPNSLKIVDEKQFLRWFGVIQAPEPVGKELEKFLKRNQ